ncbi:MAG: hypothetical protein GWN21_06670 [Gammaproteobacteria bacterium]|nr:hypothetical protein [Gammaproteobacteria bacterium]NIP46043.1 hypothetical protein [Gammaproteobacteria bacterium]NIR22832.1 hypothetical protein [Gammaproteobacteria bacterium]NIT93465.1 hypothetical protein [Gammaproteobacteria bacterium]NIV46870.1 hypothetical protein [Gammaproteobacteria bacterium]
MRLRIHRNQPAIRICGTLLGIGFVLLGLFSLLGAGAHEAEIIRERATGFGVTAIVVGIIAVLCSLLVEDLSDVWCRSPRRWK